MGAKGSVEAAKMNSDNWGHIEVGSNIFAAVPYLHEKLYYILHLHTFLATFLHTYTRAAHRMHFGCVVGV